MRFVLPVVAARAAVLGLALGLLPGCGASGTLRAAESGDYPALRQAIVADRGAGRLDAGDARAIAKAVAEFEAQAARGPVGVDRVRQLSTCARSIDGALEQLAEGDDEAAAAAALVRIEANLPDAQDRARRTPLQDSPVSPGAEAAWRAVAARVLVWSSDGPARRKLLTDGDQEIRLAALRASIDAADAADTEGVLEAARLDPYPLARTTAIRAAGAIGGEQIVLALKDAWATADDPLRESIAEAWATRRSIDAGGRRELLWAAETQRGSASIAAASALSRDGGAGASDALGVLTRAIEHGPTKDRIYAILVAPLSSAVIRAAVIKAKKDPDEGVALIALSRHIQASPENGGASAADRAAAVTELLKVANATTTRALLARSMLVQARAREVLPILERDVRSSDERVREAAATGLASLGELPAAAGLLGDAAVRVRITAACAILQAR